MTARTSPLPHFPKGVLRVFPDAETLTHFAANEFIQLGRDAIARHGRFDIALAGGSTPRGIYRHLSAAHAAALPWERVHLFFGDERTVPPEHPDSNFRMVQESLLVHPAIQSQVNVHRIEGELEPGIAADRYEAELRTHFRTDQPVFDLILLGMGTDGHTASLFPGTAALTAVSRAVVANAVPPLKTQRITLTFPCLNAAREVRFLATGADKAAMLASVLGPSGGSEDYIYPARQVRPSSGGLAWLTDEAAAQSIGF
jgi:6-phosphogluconolactonase